MDEFRHIYICMKPPQSGYKMFPLSPKASFSLILVNPFTLSPRQSWSVPLKVMMAHFY